MENMQPIVHTDADDHRERGDTEEVDGPTERSPQSKGPRTAEKHRQARQHRVAHVAPERRNHGEEHEEKREATELPCTRGWPIPRTGSSTISARQPPTSNVSLFSVIAIEPGAASRA